MVNLRNMLGLEPEPNWESMDWLRAILKKKQQEDDEGAMRVWRGRTNISILLYHLELSAREEYFNKHGALLQPLVSADDDHQVSTIRKRKRSSPTTRKRGCNFTSSAADRNPKRKRCEGDETKTTHVMMMNKKRRKMNNDVVFMVPSAAPLVLPSLPLHLKNCIASLGGGSSEEDAVLVIEKRLFKSDVIKKNNRFSIPFNQVKNKFLTQDEINFLDAKSQLGYVPNIEVMLIEPCLLNCRLNLKRWDMSTCKTYVLVKGWRSVVTRNRLHHGMMVQLWSFRVASQLWFALLQVSN